MSDMCYISVVATNKGRSEAPISSWGFVSPDGRLLVEFYGQPELPAVPQRSAGEGVPAHDSLSWYCTRESLINADGRIRPFVVSPSKGRILGDEFDL